MCFKFSRKYDRAQWQSSELVAAVHTGISLHLLNALDFMKQIFYYCATDRHQMQMHRIGLSGALNLYRMKIEWKKCDFLIVISFIDLHIVVYFYFTGF